MFYTLVLVDKWIPTCSHNAEMYIYILIYIFIYIYIYIYHYHYVTPFFISASRGPRAERVEDNADGVSLYL